MKFSFSIKRDTVNKFEEHLLSSVFSRRMHWSKRNIIKNKNLRVKTIELGKYLAISDEKLSNTNKLSLKIRLWQLFLHPSLKALTWTSFLCHQREKLVHFKAIYGDTVTVSLTWKTHLIIHISDVHWWNSNRICKILEVTAWPQIRIARKEVSMVRVWMFILIQQHQTLSSFIYPRTKNECKNAIA